MIELEYLLVKEIRTLAPDIKLTLDDLARLRPEELVILPLVDVQNWGDGRLLELTLLNLLMRHLLYFLINRSVLLFRCHRLLILLLLVIFLRDRLRDSKLLYLLLFLVMVVVSGLLFVMLLRGVRLLQ
jgi:hypothetical protein